MSGSSQSGKSAFDWDVYKSRKSALQYLRRNQKGIDTILETDDGESFEPVHSQVMSAFGEKLNDFINSNGEYIESHTAANISSSTSRWPGKIKLVRLPRLNKQTLKILVECAYTGYIRTDLPSGGIWQVLDAADHYSMDDVIRACCTFLIKNLDRKNCIEFYHIGVKYKHNLQRCAWHKIRANFKHLLKESIATNVVNNSNQMELMNTQATSTTTMTMSITQSSTTSTSNDAVMSTGEDDGIMQDPEEPQQLQARAQASQASLPVPAQLEVARKPGVESLKFEHLEPLLNHDKLNVDTEESVWEAIKLWCNHNFRERAPRVAQLLPCVRFPRFRSGFEYSPANIWPDELVVDNRQAQQQLAIMDRNHRDFLTNQRHPFKRDGFGLPCAEQPRQLRPRVPHSILLAIGGWQQGQPTRLIESYDANCNMWFECKKRIMTPLAYHGIEYIRGLLFICGGTDGNDILNELFTFDPIRGECAQRPSMREARCYVSTAYLGEHLYAMGGHNGIQRMKSVERYDLDAESWSHIQDMNVARSDASACVHENRIYIAGGLNEQVIESSVEYYNPSDNSWTYVAPMITARTSFTLILYKNALMAIGGNNGTLRLSSVEKYDFNTKVWSCHSQMKNRRSTFSAALVDDTKLIVVGGYNGQTPFNQVETFDEETQNWVSLQRIQFDRSGLKVVVVDDLPNAADYSFLGSTDKA